MGCTTLQPCWWTFTATESETPRPPGGAAVTYLEYSTNLYFVQERTSYTRCRPNSPLDITLSL